MMGKARQGPGPFAAAVAHHLWRRGPLLRMRRALAIRGLRGAGTGDRAARCPFVPGLVSVVLPVFEQADVLGDAIESVLDQTYDPFELIVVDDGSEDGVAEVLRGYIGHPRIRILRQANQKLPRALSNGFAFARGEFWTWTSADNLMHPEQLARLVAFLESHPGTAMVYADYVAIDDRGEPLADPSFRPQDRRPATSPEIHLPRDPRAINVIRDNFIGPCFLYRSIVGRLIGDYDPGLGIEDYDYWMRVNHAFRIEHLGTDETLYRYRVHENSLSGRAVELKIVERASDLMRTERERNRFYREPWTVIVDDPTDRRLSGCNRSPHRWRDLDSPVPAPGGEGKILYLADSTSLDAIADAGRPAGSIVAAWFVDVDAVYKRRIAAGRMGAIGFSRCREVAERLDLLGIPNLVVDSPESFLGLAISSANNRSFLARSRPAADRRRTLPEPLRADRPRHVLIQVDDFHQGGLENVVLGLARGLASRGFRVSMLILGRPGPAADLASEAGIPVSTIAPGRREAAYRAWLRERRVDLVCAHYSTFGAQVAGDLEIPFVQVVHNTYVWLDERAIDDYQEADAATTGYICVSAEVARYCDRRMGLSVDKMIVVPNGVDVRRLDAARSDGPGRLREELGLSPDDFVFLNVASIHATKAQGPLLRAMARVVGDRPRARLVLVGSASNPDYERGLRRTVAGLDLEHHVVLAGQRDDVGRFYWMADAFVLPSLWEGWSLALTEAACTGLPLIATSVGGARELLADVGGRLVRPPFGSICDVDAAAIPRLVRDRDPRFLDELAEAMREASGSRRRLPVAEERRRLLDEERMVDVHGSILAWFLQGGQAGAARVWSGLGARGWH
jgi:glycosyltransferase involved in cell wall biosynthesis